MTTQLQPRAGEEPAARDSSIFDRILVGVDTSPESREAVRQAAVLADQVGALTLLAVWTLPPPMVGADVPPPAPEEEASRRVAEEAVAHARASIGPAGCATTKVARGFAWDALLGEIDDEHITLVVVGSRGHGRIRGVLLGSTATELVHKAPCSVLVARQAGLGFPRRIVVGLDGSPESAAAYEVACSLRDRFGADLWPVVAHGGKAVDKYLVSTIADEWEDLQDDPVTALTAAPADGDLLVVGSRGLHGLRSLGSVSERVAHRAHCSTLIVRVGFFVRRASAPSKTKTVAAAAAAPSPAVSGTSPPADR
jgi:nucleotide-binding universal stress UspA family protein